MYGMYNRHLLIIIKIHPIYSNNGKRFKQFAFVTYPGMINWGPQIVSVNAQDTRLRKYCMEVLYGRKYQICRQYLRYAESPRQQRLLDQCPKRRQ